MRLAEPIEIEGAFWLEDVDYDKGKGLSGQLTIDTNGRAQLRLHDVNQLYLEDITKRFFQRFSGTVSPYDWITGVGSEGQLIWLHSAVTAGGLSFGGGPKVHSFFAPYVFIGKQPGGGEFTMERLDHLTFTRLICEIEGLWEWLGVSGFRYPLEIHQWFLEGCKEPLKVQYERPSNDSLQSEEPWVWHEDRPEVTLAFRVAPTTYTAPFNGCIYPEFVLKETTTIEIKSVTGTFNLHDVTEHMRMLRNFFALVMDAPVDVRQCEVRAADPWGQGKDPITDLSLYCYTGKLEGNTYEPGQVKTVLLGNHRSARANGNRWPMLRGWYQAYAEHEYAIDEYLAGRFSDAPLSSRFMSLCRSLEALTPKAKCTAQRLHCLLLPIMDNDQNRTYWVKRLKTTRNRLAHGAKKESIPPEYELAMDYAVAIYAFHYRVLTALGWTWTDLMDDRAGWLQFLLPEGQHLSNLRAMGDRENGPASKS